MVSEVTMVALPAVFVAVHTYDPASDPVTLVILSTPPDKTSALLVSRPPPCLVHWISGLGMPATALHW